MDVLRDCDSSAAELLPLLCDCDLLVGIDLICGSELRGGTMIFGERTPSAVCHAIDNGLPLYTEPSDTALTTTTTTMVTMVTTTRTTTIHNAFVRHNLGRVHATKASKSVYLFPAPESWRRLNDAGQPRTCASSVDAWRLSPTVVLVADGSMWLVRWLRNFVVQLQSGRVEWVEC